MSGIENSGAHRAYQPPPLHTGLHLARNAPADLETEAIAAHQQFLNGPAEDWSQVAHIPAPFTAAISATSGPSAAGPCAVMVDDQLVSFTVAPKHATHDPAKIATLWDAFRRVVASTPVTAPHQTQIEPRLPQQVTSVHWETEQGDVTLAHPERGRHRARRRPRRFFSLGAPAALWAVVHSKVPLAHLGFAAGIAAVAVIPAVPSPATVTPAHPAPRHIRGVLVPGEVFAPTRSGAGGPAVPPPTPRRTQMVAPAPAAATTATPDPADSARQVPTVIALPSVTATDPTTTATPTEPASTPSTPKVKHPHPAKVAKHVAKRVCVAAPLLRKVICRNR